MKCLALILGGVLFLTSFCGYADDPYYGGTCTRPDGEYAQSFPINSFRANVHFRDLRSKPEQPISFGWKQGTIDGGFLGMTYIQDNLSNNEYNLYFYYGNAVYIGNIHFGWQCCNQMRGWCHPGFGIIKSSGPLSYTLPDGKSIKVSEPYFDSDGTIMFDVTN